MKCPIDSIELMAFLNNPAGQPELGIHLAHCPSCRDHLLRLHEIAFQPPARLSCTDAEPALLAWLQDDADSALAPRARCHLEHCPACQQTVRELRLLSQHDNLSMPTYVPQPDLTFLRKPLSPLTRWRQQMNHAVQYGSYWLVNRSGEVWLSMRLVMQQQPAFAPVAVKAGPRQTLPLLQVTLTPQPDLNLELIAWPDGAGDDKVNVEVLVRRSGQFLDGFAGTAVTLYAPGEAREATTDEEGRVCFTDIPRHSLAEIELRAAG